MSKKTIGILGFGVIGKSFLKLQDFTFFDSKTVRLVVWDKRKLSESEQVLVKESGAQLSDTSLVTLSSFIDSCDFVVASAGVNLNEYSFKDKKIICELDLFSKLVNKPSIAITGSLGKTTVTKLLAKFMSYSQRAIAAGNIGLPMLSIVDRQNDFDIFVLELSSFQLERSKEYAPDIAVWNNFYPNHLDRHETLEDYFDAKFKIFKYQTYKQKSVLSLDLFTGEYSNFIQKKANQIKSQIYIVGDKKVEQIFSIIFTKKYLKKYLKNLKIISVEDNYLYISIIVDGRLQSKKRIMNLARLPFVTFRKNWLMVLATLYTFGSDMSEVEKMLERWATGSFVLEGQEHRVELCGSVNGIDFYNDSKSTVINATLEATKMLVQSGRPVVVILGGLSKGVDRSFLPEQLAVLPNVKQVYSFGLDEQFASRCKNFLTLELLMKYVFNTMQPKDQILFSPSGSSFDLFENYQHRGQVFKELVLCKINEIQN